VFSPADNFRFVAVATLELHLFTCQASGYWGSHTPYMYGAFFSATFDGAVCPWGLWQDL